MHETQRKIAWNIAMLNMPSKPGPIYFRHHKGTPAPPQTFARVQLRTKNVEITVDNILKKVSHHVTPKEIYTTKFWRNAFGDITAEGRFLACDKNLGVKYVSNAYYNALAHIEASNYETRITDVHPTEILGNMRIRLLTIADAIIDTANKPIIHYSQHSLWFLQHENAHIESNNSTDTNVFLTQLASYIKETCCGDLERFKLPALRMTLKIHKPLKNGLVPTRPIIPTCGLPNFVVGQWLGRFMARMARLIPWNLECSEDFITFITDQNRSPRVASFDFSNLYGSEPVQNTLSLFECAINELTWQFDDPADAKIFTALRTIVTVPPSSGLIDLIGNNASIFLLLLADQVQHTYATLEIDGSENILRTSNFLAMGCPPVAPLSIITLAYLEIRHIGKDLCSRGMKRYIDDIIIDTTIISEELLRSAYPSYLTLNCADNHHFLDVTFFHNGSIHVTWPYVKEFAVVPLCFFSTHPSHTIRAAAKNELVRLMNRTTLIEARPHWAEFWYTKYTLAKYPSNMLRNMIKEVVSDTKIIRDPLPRGINHVETWRGSNTGSGKSFTTTAGTNVSVAWKSAPSLLSIAIKAHVKR